jgi:hypothetical protein
VTDAEREHETEALVAGFLAALAHRTPAGAAAAPCEGPLPDRVLRLAGAIAARHRDRAADDESRQHLRAAAVVLAAHHLLAGALPGDELGALLRDCWLRGVRRARPAAAWLDAWADPTRELASSRWQSLAAMLFCMIGLPGPTLWLVERLGGSRGAASRAIEDELWRELCAAEAVPELAPMLGAGGARAGRDGA